jgi:hypothetical protein
MGMPEDNDNSVRPATDTEKRFAARQTYVKALEAYLNANGWVSVAVSIPVPASDLGGGSPMKTVWMWVRKWEMEKGHLHNVLSTKLALESQEEIDGDF